MPILKNVKIRRSRKTKNRKEMIERLVASLTDAKVLHVINVKTWSEVKIQTYLHRPLRSCVREILKELYPKQLENTIDRKVGRSILWSSDAKIDVPKLEVFGVNHLVDFVVFVDGTRFAVEVKRAEDGANVREGIGQCLFYSTNYDFVLYLIFDATPSKKILRSMTNKIESALTRKLWEVFNIRIVVV